jgi:hypothetical protein
MLPIFARVIGGQPRFVKLSRMCSALGVKLVARAVHT